jgi:hypothetical protein
VGQNVTTEGYTPGIPRDRKRKATKAKAKAPGPFSLVEIVTTDEAPDMLDLFSIDGVTYQIPAEPSAGMALKVLDVARRDGMEAAMSQCLEELLGEESYQALLNCKSLKIEQLEAIMEGVQLLVLGKLEGALGK